MGESTSTATYVGQVERDPEGILWAVLYCRDQIIEREQVRSLRKAKRRVTSMVLAAADTFPMACSAPVVVCCGGFRMIER